MHRPSNAPEHTSFGMGVVAVAIGVGYGVLDTIARRVHRHDDGPAWSNATFDSRRATPAAGARPRVTA